MSPKEVRVYLIKKRHLYLLIVSCIVLFLGVGCTEPILGGYKGAFYFYDSADEQDDLSKIIINNIQEDKKADIITNLDSRKASYFSKDVDNVHIIMLDSNEILKGDKNIAMKQLEWLKKDLMLHKMAKFKLIAMEQPYYTSSSSKKREARKIYEALEPILRAYNIDLIINGDVEAYERYEKNNIVDITTGFSKDSLRISEDFKGKKAHSKALYLNKLQYVRVSRYENGLKLEAISCGSYTGDKFISRNEIIDSYTIIKKN